MSEFNNRISAQRDILVSINTKGWQEELFGLSRGAIERWANLNKIGSDSMLLKLINESAAKLFFLANKSQEQITDDYKLLSNEVSTLTKKIQKELERITAQIHG